MVILLVGGGSALMNAVIDKLNKNGHRVYLLTGQKERKFSYSRVFEKYNFPYDSGSIKDILESVKPDVTVFTGAYDTNFTWESPRQDGVRYMAGLMNILSACSMMKKGRFLYFSSQEVFGAPYIDDIGEEEPVSPNGPGPGGGDLRQLPQDPGDGHGDPALRPSVLGAPKGGERGGSLLPDVPGGIEDGKDIRQ